MSRPKVELTFDPARVVPMPVEEIVFRSTNRDYPRPFGSRIVIYVVEDVDGADAEVIFVGHTKRGEAVAVRLESGD